ncbi:MAG: WecB/TagA/CpsF family glycosyltransferase, partial [Clostridia bacterium]|nr:WecB/TagA/CpsF family glycosyltransferase [Clostridia bacterium]
MSGRISILGMDFDPETVRSAAEKTVDGALKRIGAACPPRPFFVVTPNPLILSNALKDGSLREIAAAADLCLPDGVGIVGAAKRQGTPLPCRVPGIEVGEAALSFLARTGERVFIVGGAPGRAAEAGVRLMDKYPGLIVCGTADGYSESDDASLPEQIASARPALVVVCLGSPKQEKWAYANLEALRGAGAVICLGGAVDVWSG